MLETTAKPTARELRDPTWYTSFPLAGGLALATFAVHEYCLEMAAQFNLQ